MTPETFDTLLDRRIGLIRAVLQSKSTEYATSDDRLNNFRRIAEMRRQSMGAAAWGLVVKQIISVQDMIESGRWFPQAAWDEKIGDVINYMILIEAIATEDRP